MEAKKVEVEVESESESEIDSIDLLMESYVNLDEKVKIICEHIKQQTKMLEEICELLCLRRNIQKYLK